MSVMSKIERIRRLFRVADEMDQLASRFEFVRRELLFEMRYGRKYEQREPEAALPQVLDQAKLDAALASGLRVNVGCGHVPLDGYVNVDMRAVPGVDVLASIDELPFPDGSVTEIVSFHVLEHFPQEMLRRSILPHWRAKLAPEGIVRAIVPDGETMLRRAAEGTYAFEDFREVLFGAQDYDGDFHYNMFTPKSLGELFAEAGLVDIATPVRGRPKGKCFECEVSGRRPS